MSEKPRVWSQSIRLPDGRVFEIPYLATAEHIRRCRTLAWWERWMRWWVCRRRRMSRWRSWKNSFTWTLAG